MGLFKVINGSDGFLVVVPPKSQPGTVLDDAFVDSYVDLAKTNIATKLRWFGGERMMMVMMVILATVAAGIHRAEQVRLLVSKI